jgi:mercuric ion binding protein
MKTLLTAAFAAVLLSIGGAIAAERTVTLAVQNVTCATCAPIVKKTLARVPGVSQVSVVERGEVATATVTFDDTQTTIAALITATTNAGYPSRPQAE